MHETFQHVQTQMCFLCMRHCTQMYIDTEGQPHNSPHSVSYDRLQGSFSTVLISQPRRGDNSLYLAQSTLVNEQDLY